MDAKRVNYFKMESARIKVKLKKLWMFWKMYLKWAKDFDEGFYKSADEQVGYPVKRFIGSKVLFIIVVILVIILYRLTI